MVGQGELLHLNCITCHCVWYWWAPLKAVKWTFTTWMPIIIQVLTSLQDDEGHVKKDYRVIPHQLTHNPVPSSCRGRS